MQPDEFITHVRDGDYDRFLCIQLAPVAKRAALYLLTTFHLELAHVAEVAREPLVAHMRFAWWREGVDELLAGKLSRPHPLLKALQPLLQAHPALAPLLHQMIDARAADVDAELLATEAGWLNYLDGTAGALHAAWAEVLDANAAAQHRDAIAAQARDYAMLGLLRAIPFGVRRFPEKRLRFDAGEAALAQDVMALLQEYPRPVGHLSRSLLPIMGLQALAKKHRKKLEKEGGNLRATASSPMWPVLCILGLKIKHLL